MNAADHVRGVYLITDGVPRSDPALRAYYGPLLAAGVAVLQYRDKGDDQAQRRREAMLLAALCRRQGVLFIVNDDVDLALYSGADGVHLGREDAPIAGARARLGERVVIGVSCYGSLERAERLAAAGADYLAFGAAYPSATKPGAPRASLETLAAARQRFACPVVAIGGINPDNAAPLVRAGVDALAVIHGVHGARDPVAAVRRLAELMRQAL
ncbi:MAG: thiamine phosphate synthase [Ectothiorhodospiraceae bacterium]|nr:thiamine phosphate synthase [Ectothiorhodospiraceae bacterium]